VPCGRPLHALRDGVAVRRREGDEVTFVLVLCERDGCTKKHGVVAVKRRHKAYTGPEVSPLRVPGDDPAVPPLAGSSPSALTGTQE
jgi:hypothetical protein